VNKKDSDTWIHNHKKLSTWTHAHHVKKIDYLTLKQKLKTVAKPKSNLRLLQSYGNSKAENPT
jgi:hypothetical protein